MSLAQPAESGEELRVTIRAWDYRPAEHSLPIRRQSVTEIRPSDEAVTDARQVLDSCGARTREDGAVGR